MEISGRHGRRTIPRIALIISVAVAALTLPLAAVSAAPAPDFGDHGAQARCRYVSEELPGWSGAMRLNRIRVQPPTLYSAAGPRQVGWRMLVQRQYDFESWKGFSASAIQRADATPTTAADFEALSAYINSPLFNPGDVGADYRVVLKFYWFRNNGTINRIERHVVANYDTFRDGKFMWTDQGSCHHAWVFE